LNERKLPREAGPPPRVGDSRACTGELAGPLGRTRRTARGDSRIRAGRLAGAFGPGDPSAFGPGYSGHTHPKLDP